MTILGIDMGATKTTLVLYEGDTLAPLASRMFQTNAADGFPAVQARLLAAINDFRRPDTAAIGLGAPGVVDPRTRRVLTMPNIPESQNQDLRGFLQKETSLPVALENDARCFALAEALHGAGKGHEVVVGVALGTGVGGGIVINGEIYHGSRGYAGEIGHALLVPGRPPYPAKDKRGEIEQFLSGTAFAQRCKAAKTPEEYLEGEVCAFLRPEVFREVAWMVVTLFHIVDPSVIVFGGAAGRALEPHLPAIREEITAWLLPGFAPPEIRCGHLENAAALGAAMLGAKEKR